MTDAAFRIHISLYLSLSVNLLYVATNLFSGFWYGSAWFVILATYYTILAVMRFLLLRYVNKTGIGKDRTGYLYWIERGQPGRICAGAVLSDRQ